MKFEAEKSHKLKNEKYIVWTAICAVIVSWSAGFSQISESTLQYRGASVKDVVSITIDSLNLNAAFITDIPSQLPPHRDDGNGELLWSFYDENAVSDRTAISGDGNWLAISYMLNDERLELRNATDGELIFTYPLNDASGYTDLTHDGSIIAYGAINDLWMFNREDGNEPVWNFNIGNLVAGPLKFTTDGTYLIATGTDPQRETNVVWCFEIGEDDPIWTFEAEADAGFGWYGISLAEDANIIVVNEKYTLFVLSLDEGEMLWTEPTFNSESEVAISANGSILAIPSLTGRLRVFGRDREGDGYSELWHYSFRDASGSWITSCAISPNGHYIAAGTLDFFDDHAEGRLALFDSYGNGAPMWIADPVGDEISDIVFNQSGTIIAASSWGDIDHEGGDLFLHEVHNREPFYQLVTPGSMSTVVMSEDGSRVATCGKSVHNRQFGRGGRVYVVQIGLTGGDVSGTIIDDQGEPIADAVVTAVDNPYNTNSDENGEYRLRVELADEWEERTIIVAARGFNRVIRDEIGVWEGEISPNINFSLEEVDSAPVDISATQGVRNRITIGWEPYNGNGITSSTPSNQRIKTATGNPINIPGVTPWDKAVDPLPKRDNSDDAEQINIYRSPVQGGPYRLIGIAEGDQDSYTDQNRIFPLVSYYYVITAEFENGESYYSEEVIGNIDDNFLIWEADLESMPVPPELDGVISEEEWEGAVVRDISDVFGYDQPDSAGSVDALIGFSDETDRLYIALKYYAAEQLIDRMGIGVYVDDDADGAWNYTSSGSEGNYWGYWIDEEPVIYYRSLSGPPYTGDPFYQFEDAEISIVEDNGYVNLEMAIPLGFRGTQEIAVFAPEYNIGLALFAMTRDDNGNPIFQGWWPQDVLSIVSNPYQFAQVHIPVDLIVPPEAPSEIFVERDGDDLLLSWIDPVLGIDNGEIDGLAGINIYKNSEHIHTIDPGQNEWVDESIDELGWYEYMLSGFVLEDDSPFLGPLTQSVGIYGVREPDVSVITQDDSTVEVYFIVDITGEDNRFAVKYQFDVVEDTLGIYWIEFIPNSLSPIDLYIAENDNGVPGSMIGERYTTQANFAQEPYRFHFPGTDQPRILIDPDGENEYWVVMNYLPGSPGAPALGIDRSSTDPVSNKYYQAESGWHDMESGLIMVRLGIGAAPAGAPEIEPPPLPVKFRVGQNYPNPFNSSTIIPVELPIVSRLTIDVYDIDGRIYMSQDQGVFNAGYHLVSFDSGQMPAGIYFLAISAGKVKKLIKVILIK